MLFASCNKNLDVAPTKEFEDAYFGDEDHLQRGVGAIYAKLTDLYSYNANAPHQRLWLLPGDDLRANNPFQLDNFSGLNSSDGDINAVWKTLYEIINRSNTMLDNITKNKNVYTTSGLADFNRGEALFLRGWSFYKLWSWWQKAPLILNKIGSYKDPVYNGPSEGLQMLDQGIADMKEAATLLPATWANNQTGRVTKDAAYGMLVKCYVTRACYNGKNADDYQQALAAFAAISAGRHLVPFGDNFDYRQENNAESLFEFQASASGTENPFLNNDFGNNVGNMGAFYQFYEDTWTNQQTLLGPTLKLVNAFDAADPRIPETFQPNGNKPWEFNMGYKFVKYINGDRGKYDGLAAINSPNNVRILRLADVKLLAAEAYLQTGHPDDALKQVNDIRERARKSLADGGEAAQPVALAAVNIQSIMNERFLELAGEGVRWNDLCRWHVAGYINLATWTKQDFGFPDDYGNFNFKAGTHLLMPIPQSELDANPDMLAGGQNTGY